MCGGSTGAAIPMCREISTPKVVYYFLQSQPGFVQLTIN